MHSVLLLNFVHEHEVTKFYSAESTVRILLVLLEVDAVETVMTMLR